MTWSMLSFTPELIREGFTTATRAAAAGGVTTIVDMPLYKNRYIIIGDLISE